MRTEQIKTPFGRRGVTLALVKRQVDARQVKAGKRVEKCFAMWPKHANCLACRPIA